MNVLQAILSFKKTLRNKLKVWWCSIQGHGKLQVIENYFYSQYSRNMFGKYKCLCCGKVKVGHISLYRLTR